MALPVDFSKDVLAAGDWKMTRPCWPVRSNDGAIAIGGPSQLWQGLDGLQVGWAMPTPQSGFVRKGQPLTADAESMPDGGLLVQDGDSFRSMVWPRGGSSQPSDPAGSASGSPLLPWSESLRDGLRLTRNRVSGVMEPVEDAIAANSSAAPVGPLIHLASPRLESTSTLCVSILSPSRLEGHRLLSDPHTLRILTS
jgi:hypothetical protein